jgi:hypothetical protein
LIPLNKPVFLFETIVPEYGWPDAMRPVPAGSLVLLACGGGYARQLSPSRLPVLVALDAQTGAERFRVDVPNQGRDVAAGLPLVQPDGHILLPVYQHDCWLKVLRIDPTGSIVREDELGQDDGCDRRHDLRLIAFDVGIKLRLAPLAPGPTESYLISWRYRGSRFYWIEYRNPSDAISGWASAEWMLGTTPSAVVGETIPRDGAQLVVRRKTTGEKLWTASLAERTVVGVQDEGIWLLDHSRRAREFAQREDVILEEVVDVVGLTQEELDLHYQNHPLQCPSDIILLDPGTGREQWRTEVPGAILNSQTGPGGLCALSAKEDGQGRLWYIGLQGDRCEIRTVQGRKGAHWPPSSQGWPRLLAHDGSHLLWHDETDLICDSLSRLNLESWRLPLPAPAPVPLYEPWTEIAAAGQMVFLRRACRLYALSSDPTCCSVAS